MQACMRAATKEIHGGNVGLGLRRGLEAWRNDDARRLLGQPLRHLIIVFDLEDVRNDMADQMDFAFRAARRSARPELSQNWIIHGESEHVVARIAAVEQQAGDIDADANRFFALEG